MAAQRIGVQEAHEHLESNPGALLICAYDSDEKFQANHLEGAISLDDFRLRMGSLDKDTELIFYCA